MSMTPGRNLFKEFKGNHNVFVETGSYRGDGIQLAIDAGFKKIISIDIDHDNIEFCMNRFDQYRNIEYKDIDINLFCGDSALCLGELLKVIDEPPMFWLDAHAQHFEGEILGDNPFPLIDELYAIENSCPSGSTIFIDDMLHLTHPRITSFNNELIEYSARLAIYLAMPSQVKIQYFANPVKDSILLAHL